jgi:hypothetical protein
LGSSLKISNLPLDGMLSSSKYAVPTRMKIPG